MRATYLFTAILIPYLAGTASAQVTVCQGGGCNSNTIQGGILLANPGQVVQVIDAGATTYVENLDFLGKGIVVEVPTGSGPITVVPAASALPTVSFTSGESRLAVLRNFTITGATDSTAVLCVGSAPTLESNTITGNGSQTLVLGGGVTADSAAPRLFDNVLSTNVNGASGAGLLATGSAAATGEVLELEANDFFGNVAAFQGGGAALIGVNEALVVENLFAGQDVAFGWPVHCDSAAAPGGGALAVISTGDAPVLLLDNQFSANHSWQFGGALLCVGSSPTVTSTGATSFAGNAAECNGGGMALMHQSSPVVRDYLFDNDNASVNGGGGAAMFASNAQVLNCEFRNCDCLGVDDPNGTRRDAYGGGFYIEDASPTIRGSDFEFCVARGGDEAFGGGIAVVDGPNQAPASPRILSCELEQNQAHTAGGGIWSGSVNAGFGLLDQIVTIRRNRLALNGTVSFLTAEPARGGGIAIEGGNADITRNTLLKNRANSAGAGIYAADLRDISLLRGNMVVKNELADDFGLTSGTGTGIWFSGDVERLIHNTVARNQALPATIGGGLFVLGGSAEVWNTIAWSNAGVSDIAGSPGAYFCDVDKMGGWVDVIGNFRRNPQFVSPIADDFHLRFSSPCVNRGDATVPGITIFDIDGQSRVLDGRTDLGADEVDLPDPIDPQ